MAKHSSPFRYTQRRGEMPKLALRVEMLPRPDGLKPCRFSVLDGLTVVGTLSIIDLEKAIAEFQAGQKESR